MNLFNKSQRKLSSILRKSTLYRSINRTKSHAISNRRFKVPIINGTAIRQHENWMFTLLGNLVEPDKGFLDVGANIGQTMLKVAALDRRTTYLGFEPNPFCVSYLEKLITLNSLKGYNIIPAGLGSTTSVLTLEMSGETGDASATLIKNFRPNRVVNIRKTVVVLSLDDISESLIPSNLSTVKIDVEGSESEVIRGLLPLLRAKQPNVLLEVLPCYDGTNVERFARQCQIEKDLADIGYQIHRVIKKGDEFDDLMKVKDFGKHSDQSMCDYVLLPE